MLAWMEHLELLMTLALIFLSACRAATQGTSCVVRHRTSPQRMACETKGWCHVGKAAPGPVISVDTPGDTSNYNYGQDRYYFQ